MIWAFFFLCWTISEVFIGEIDSASKFNSSILGSQNKDVDLDRSIKKLRSPNLDGSGPFPNWLSEIMTYADVFNLLFAYLFCFVFHLSFCIIYVSFLFLEFYNLCGSAVFCFPLWIKQFYCCWLAVKVYEQYCGSGPFSFCWPVWEVFIGGNWFGPPNPILPFWAHKIKIWI